MAKLTKDAFVKALKEMTLLEINELVEGLKEEFGIDPTAVAVAGPAAGGAQTGAEEEKSEYNVILKSFGDSKINVIKVVRTITGLGLADAKKLTETPDAVIKEKASKADAEEILNKLKEAGATAELK